MAHVHRRDPGGRHLYFAVRGSDVRNSAGKLAPLVDVRAAGGYMIGPCSRIGDRGYVQRNSACPAPLPDWLATLLSTPPPPAVPWPHGVPEPGRTGTAYAMAALHNEAERVATAVDGTRHDTLNKAAYKLGQLVGAGLLPELVVVTSLADAATQSGLCKQREIHRIICSGMNAGARHPRVPRQTPPPRSAGPRPPRLPRDGPAAPVPRPAV